MTAGGADAEPRPARAGSAGAVARAGDGAGGGHLDALIEFVHRSRRLLVLTGAGCSTESGIPDYRDDGGAWKRQPPIGYQAFVTDVHARRRYWARSMIGWKHIRLAHPNAAHRALADLERSGPIHHLITQNVDGLHQRAGSRAVLDLHGRLDTVTCIDCGIDLERAALQATLEARNPVWKETPAPAAPDGDADLEEAGIEHFEVPDCPHCAGILKPAVVFFGESVPRGRVARAFKYLDEADALLVVGSSLTVFSGYRFVREAVRRDYPVAIVNRGRTRADGEVALKIEASCGAVLPALAPRG